MTFLLKEKIIKDTSNFPLSMYINIKIRDNPLQIIFDIATPKIPNDGNNPHTKTKVPDRRMLDNANKIMNFAKTWYAPHPLKIENIKNCRKIIGAKEKNILEKNIDCSKTSFSPPIISKIGLGKITNTTKKTQEKNNCNKRYELSYIKEFLEDKDNNYSKPPKCIECNGIIKSATISFGQPMPIKEMQIAEKASIECDLFIDIGSSLKVYPAAGLPILAKKMEIN